MPLRKTFVMSLNPGCRAEYQRRHDELWPEMVDLLHTHGVRNYTIALLEETNQLFGYAEIESEAQWAAIADTEVCRRWWDHMQDIMATNPDNSPRSIELVEVFHLE
ncbi:L-rhamnose mutarotase [Posidoniimonas corsicana]|uniref:L-rhamnose mutarotase n=1 Tax=Posidoniimonas corsicana TaxID=1938618 RepID=A0A5C5VHR4_9BACT|nr:L-rhamnose mutarotase [Posidoniimonas corsicana]TWT37490.1 L-rhamnose mutarotase [Posidoniimonas corsicana]